MCQRWVIAQKKLSTFYCFISLCFRGWRHNLSASSSRSDCFKCSSFLRNRRYKLPSLEAVAIFTYEKGRHRNKTTARQYIDWRQQGFKQIKTNRRNFAFRSSFSESCTRTTCCRTSLPRIAAFQQLSRVWKCIGVKTIESYEEQEVG